MIFNLLLRHVTYLVFNNMRTQTLKENTDRGFTLIEVLIAVVIFSTAVAGLLLIVGTGIGDVNMAKNRLVANYLAQEGIEIMRFKRDHFTETNPSGGWSQFQTLLNTVCTQANPCGVSAIRPLDPPIDCGPNNPTNCTIVEDRNSSTATGAYTSLGDPGSSGWPQTIYTRKIYLETPQNNSNDAYIIHSSVTWSQGTGTYTTSMSETIYNWQ